MPEYLLDTTTITHYLRDTGNAPGLPEELCTAGGLLCCCPVNIVEIYEGMKDKEKTATDEFLNSLNCHEISQEVGYIAGNLKRKYSKKGLTLSTADVLIAAIAIKNHLTLVTNNAKHFPPEEITILSYDR